MDSLIQEPMNEVTCSSTKSKLRPAGYQVCASGGLLVRDIPHTCCRCQENPPAIILPVMAPVQGQGSQVDLEMVPEGAQLLEGQVTDLTAVGCCVSVDEVVHIEVPLVAEAQAAVLADVRPFLCVDAPVCDQAGLV